ncbi:histidine kinase [Actibacterium mucosum KCTC 23349]|uniref:histidine kinase n=1 Tax=Actibacterium mucosum KCTC 23349 TaxID=1454373 RepID=A0A037ZN75_9RHOB|nr:PAS-domain containing protein [Actibacterium mucosum]KAJ57534.1 histidine kinase [Actibacterium mucosum KCTC 23349]
MTISPKDRARMTEAGLNLIQQALSIYDADLKLVVCNQRFGEMFSLPDHLCAVGSDFAETIRYLVDTGEYGAVEDVDQFVQDRVDQARTFQQHYMERTRANGHTISVEGSPLPSGGWVTVYTDITAIKEQEALLRTRSAELSTQLLDHAERLAQSNREFAAINAALGEAGRQLTEMEARTRTVTRMMPAHIAHVGPDGAYTYSNRRLGEVMPHPPDRIEGRYIGDVLGDAIFGYISPHLDNALAGDASVFEFNHPHSGRRVRCSFTPDIGAEGTVNGVYILSMDVTEETQARAALAQTAKRELAAQLSSGLAHDFANLLTIILGLQGQLGRRVTDPQASEIIAATQAVARRGGILLDKIAAISGPRQVSPEPTQLPEFLENIRLIAAPSLPADISLSVEVKDVSHPLMLDAGGVQDALLNLIFNARDAIGEGPGQIHIRAAPQGVTWLQITVTDTGPGFSQVALREALNPFFTTKGQEGSGLGLSMVYDIAKLSGGQVNLANTALGARIELLLPLKTADAQATPRMVLLVEDSPDIRETVRDMLTDMNHTVIEASSVEEAATLTDLPGIDVVLSDILLDGDETGIDLLDALAKQSHPAQRVLMTSLPKTDPRRALAEGRYPVLSKPVSAARLAASLQGGAV